MRSEQEIREMAGMLESFQSLTNSEEHKAVMNQLRILKWVLGQEMYPDEEFSI